MLQLDPYAAKLAADAARAARTRVLLIGCGKTKADTRGGPVPARDLYTGNLFRARRAYADATGCPWWIVSAEWGLVEPETELRSYDRTIDELSTMQRRRWGLVVLQDVAKKLPHLQAAELLIELHAGRLYFDALRANKRPGDPPEIDRPLGSLGIGHQLSWYMDNTPTHAR